MNDITHSRDDPDDIETVYVGFFRYRGKKGAPWQPLRVMRESGRWIVLLNGTVVQGSGHTKAKHIPFLSYRAPFHEITEAEYHDLIRQYREAPPGDPLRTPDEAVDVRSAPIIYRGSES